MALANDLQYAAHKLYISTSRAAWITGTTFLVLLFPLIISMDREQQALDAEKQQLNVLTGAQGGASK